MSRARSSLTSIPGYLHRRISSRSQNVDSPTYASSSLSSFTSPARPVISHSPSSGYEPRAPLFPRIPHHEMDLGFEDLPEITDASHGRSRSHSHIPRLSSARRDGRASSLLSSLGRPDRGIRSLSSLRRRRSPLGRDEDQAVILSRLLSAAAAATAASLMGDDHRAVAEARSVAGDGEDGTFDSFLQALQNGRIASALRQSNTDGEGGLDGAGANPVPLNFFRMFRFGTSTDNRPDMGRSGSRGSGAASSENDDGDGGNGRMVPIIIVGIRSFNPGAGNPQDDNIPPFLDALSSFPTPMATPGESDMDGILPQPQQRFSHRRRASMGGLNPFPSNYDSQRHHRAPDRQRPWSSFTDSPSGPLPPPSTPASSGLSAVSSGINTPTSSTTPPSPTVQSTAPSRRGSFVRRPTGSNLEPTVEEPQTQPRVPRQRRMSESDFTRFGSGSSRRNGVVEPDHNPGEGSRSWIIYVLGGSYPENHPLVTTPSLFSDSPTYEDMMLLSTLLGPAKPPVASEEDVASAPGLFAIESEVGVLVAQSLDGAERFQLASDQRCLVCLCDFEATEEARKLVNCGHFFHKECIDQWLTTGRNSCPLCRGEGVKENPSETPQATPTDFADSGPPQMVL
ncbi:hypothetical protein B0J11DRAFT_438567 [Dendryphion nanum]|uniref:RING-type domain-containing protein n=1 Tax=Dendryphion nanum TaxID=256645 RepID=A0A9P9DLJ3_9PLEO|nr:hypothetical protein B0J11DRAFT_438567 [Dendryphion nanum]